MSIQCTLEIDGLDPKKSNQAFLKSFKKTSDIEYCKKYETQINKIFQEKINQNISQNQLPLSLRDTFFINFKNDGIYFNSQSLAALKYEFGANDTPPKRYIEPAVMETADEVSKIMITDAIDLYNKYTRFV